MREWQSQDVEVLVSTNDVSTLEGTEQLIAEACTMGPVGGVFHLAMVTNNSVKCRVILQYIEIYRQTLPHLSSLSVDWLVHHMVHLSCDRNISTTVDE